MVNLFHTMNNSPLSQKFDTPSHLLVPHGTVHISPYLQQEWMVISRNWTVLLTMCSCCMPRPLGPVSAICPFPQISQDGSGRSTWISTYCRRAGEDQGPFARHQCLQANGGSGKISIWNKWRRLLHILQPYPLTTLHGMLRSGVTQNHFAPLTPIDSPSNHAEI